MSLQMSLQTRIEEKTARVTIVGQGYVGLPLAVELVRAGFRVTGLESDGERAAALTRGESYIQDVTTEMLQQVIQAGRFVATSDVAALADQDVIVLCVPTPLRKSKDPDVSHIVASARDVARCLAPGQLVVLESTTYPGTTEEVLLPMFEERGLRAGQDFYLAFSPERIDPGNPVYQVKEIPKLVGGITPTCTRMAAVLYRQIVGQVFELSSPTVAELSKLYENTFRSVNIALANEMALICRHLGVSVWEVIDAAATKPFGFMAFSPGPGIGGHCIPLDPAYLAWQVRRDVGQQFRILEQAQDVNAQMPGWVAARIGEALNQRAKPLKGARVLILGVAYKPDVGDVRESPSLRVMSVLERRGAKLTFHDPFVDVVTVNGRRLARVELT